MTSTASSRDANGEQFGFSVADGRIQGHVDGVIVAGPEGFGYAPQFKPVIEAVAPSLPLELIEV